MTHDEIRKAARIAFSTPDGKAVLDHLKRLYYDNSFNQDEVMRQVGRRDVVLGLLRLIGDKHE